MSIKLLESFPYPEAREIQVQALRLLEDSWDKYDVFVLAAPTAFGKSAVAKTLMSSLRSVSVITPTNLLVQQFLDEFPDTPTLSRLDSYQCEEWKRPCSTTRGKCRKFCEGCPASAALATAKYRRGPGVYNYHTYLAHGIYRDVLVVDEAHNLLPVIRDRMGIRIWQHDAKYPHNMWRPEQVQEWLASLPERKRKQERMRLLAESVQFEAPEYIMQRTREPFNGKGTVRGQPEDRDCIRLLPVDVRDAPPMFWPGLGFTKQPTAGKVRKLVLLSATISKYDVEALGLAGRRVCYIDCLSPIPASNRPIVVEPVVSVSRHNMEQAADRLADYIRTVAQHHEGEKGVIHATYQMASLLAARLGGEGRFLFHDRHNKSEQYTLFRNAPPESGRILVACGMYEGIDLPQDLGRWQVISKIPWQSLGNPAIAHQAKLDPHIYTWETLKTVIQACGRICRTPTDWGVTYCPDSSIFRLLRESEDYGLIPQWFREAIVR